MFDIGFGEMILLAAIALIAIGPKQLPQVARTVGKLIGELQKLLKEVTTTMVDASTQTDQTIRKVQDDIARLGSQPVVKASPPQAAQSEQNAPVQTLTQDKTNQENR